jgi:hypothetical protein
MTLMQLLCQRNPVMHQNAVNVIDEWQGRGNTKLDPEASNSQG